MLLREKEGKMKSYMYYNNYRYSMPSLAFQSFSIPWHRAPIDTSLLLKGPPCLNKDDFDFDFLVGGTVNKLVVESTQDYRQRWPGLRKTAWENLTWLGKTLPSHKFPNSIGSIHLVNCWQGWHDKEMGGWGRGRIRQTWANIPFHSTHQAGAYLQFL